MIQSGSITVSISNNTITRTSGSFISEGFEVGNKITIYNSRMALQPNRILRRTEGNDRN